MGKFDDELNKTKNEGSRKIGKYLLEHYDRKEKLDNPKKSLEECFLYCASMYIENAKDINGVCKFNGDDDNAIYSHAIHYYDEDDIVIDKRIFDNVKIKTKVTNDNEIKKDVPKKKKVPKKDALDGQLSLF